MISLKITKMKEIKDRLSTKEDMRKAREELERNTEEDFRRFARAKLRVRELARRKHLD